MCACGVEFACKGGCICGCSHTTYSFYSWTNGYVKGRSDAAQSVSMMRDVDEVCMEEIETDPDLDESYILVRRSDAAAAAKGGDSGEW